MPATRYDKMTVGELRERARSKRIPGIWRMRKDELVEVLRGGGAGEARAATNGRGPGAKAGSRGSGGVRTGPKSSKSLRYVQEVSGPGEREERPGKTLVTTDHEVIRRWADRRGGRPATTRSRRGGGPARTLRFDFGDPDEGLEEISWDEWFATFDDRRLNFIYQEHKADGSESNFFRLENPDREDA